MAYNIQMNYFDGSSYEELYPYTTMEQVENLSNAINSNYNSLWSTFNSRCNGIENDIEDLENNLNNKYNELLSSISNTSIKTQLVERQGTGTQGIEVSVVFDFLPIFIYGFSIAGMFNVYGLWANNIWSITASGDINSVYSTTTSGTIIKWVSKEDSHERIFFNDNRKYYFLGFK